MPVNEQNQKIKELNITEKTLCYPFALKDAINNAKSGNEPVAFVKFTPSSPKIIMPVIKKEVQKKDLKTTEPKVEIKEQQIYVDAIFLPIRPISDEISAKWSNIEGMALGNISAYLKWKLYKSLSGVANAVLPSEVVYAMKTGQFGGGIDNPHERLAFAGHERRNFTIAWEFMKPESREEEEMLTKIISMFKMSALGGYSATVITPPISWEVSFNSFPDYKNFVKYKRVGFTTVNSTFGGEGDFHAMQSGMPFVSLTLTGSELDYPTQKDVWMRPSGKTLIDTEFENDVAVDLSTAYDTDDSKK
ncbi:MAG TPA: hypothetical protein PK151_04375 [Caldisericia bacterium]|nr:hypothetical protein [Caldisericia bacterium]